MTDCVIGPDSVLDRVILDKEVVVGANCQLGVGSDGRSNRLEPRRLNTGITIVGKRARVPSCVQLGRNCRVDAYVMERDFDGRLEVASGDSVLRAEERGPVATIAGGR
jgi:glucose-1-phosphate adenylyltransferase